MTSHDTSVVEVPIASTPISYFEETYIKNIYPAYTRKISRRHSNTNDSLQYVPNISNQPIQKTHPLECVPH